MAALTGSDAGETLLELLVAIGIFLIAGVAVLTGFATVATGTGVHQDQAEVETYLRNAAEYALGPAVPYVACATPATYQAKFALAGAPSAPTAFQPYFTQTVTSVTYWDGTRGGGSFLAVCPAADKGMQQVTLTVKLALPGKVGTTAESVSIVKRTA